MKKIILFSLLYQFLFSILSLLLIMIKEKFGSELFAYALYFNVFYFAIGVFTNVLLIIFIKSIPKYSFYIWFVLGIFLFFNLCAYFLGDKIILFFELFNLKSDVWHISLSYHLGILLSVIIMYFLSGKRIFNFLDEKYKN